MFILKKSKAEFEKKIVKWLMASEQEKRPRIIAEQHRFGGRKILVLTDFRAILFEVGCFTRLKDTSDKIWRQFIAVHLVEKLCSASLKLRFFHYHDSVLCHNPYQEMKCLEENEFKSWRLDGLNKKEAEKVYSFLKEKELDWQEKRRKEQIEQQRIFMERMLHMRSSGGDAAGASFSGQDKRTTAE